MTEMPDFVARAIEAQGKTTVVDVLAVLRENPGLPPDEPMQTTLDEADRADADTLYAALPSMLMIEHRHKAEGARVWADICAANTGDQGTRDRPYRLDDAQSEFGYVVEAAFRDAKGHGCTCSEVDHEGRKAGRHTPDLNLLGWDLDVKWTHTAKFYVGRHLLKHQSWYFVTYRCALGANEARLVGAAFGADFVKFGRIVTEWERGKGQNVELDPGYRSTMTP